MMKRPEHLYNEESLGNWAWLAWRGDVWEEILEKSRNVLRVGVKTMVPDSFLMPSVMTNNHIRDNRNTVKHRKFYLNMRKNLFEGNRALEQDAWRGCGIFSSGKCSKPAWIQDFVLAGLGCMVSTTEEEYRTYNPATLWDPVLLLLH